MFFLADSMFEFGFAADSDSFTASLTSGSYIRGVRRVFFYYDISADIPIVLSGVFIQNLIRLPSL